MSSNIDQNQLEELINTAARKSGIDRSRLRSVVDGSSLDNALSALKPDDARRVEQILSDKNATQRLLSTPQAQEILKKLMGNGK